MHLPGTPCATVGASRFSDDPTAVTCALCRNGSRWKPLGTRTGAFGDDVIAGAAGAEWAFVLWERAVQRAAAARAAQAVAAREFERAERRHGRRLAAVGPLLALSGLLALAAVAAVVLAIGASSALDGAAAWWWTVGGALAGLALALAGAALVLRAWPAPPPTAGPWRVWALEHAAGVAWAPHEPLGMGGIGASDSAAPWGATGQIGAVGAGAGLAGAGGAGEVVCPVCAAVDADAARASFEAARDR